MSSRLVVAIDQGTTSSRAVLFDELGRAVFASQREFPQHYPRDGWVEHDPEAIWDTTRDCLSDALARGGRAVQGIGVTNQRETVVVWDRGTGRPVHPAIVWQDRRTAADCRELVDAGLEPEIVRRTGLVVDPYFSATKIAWILDHVEGARARAEAGDLAFGTIDTFLIWRLTGGRVHATDVTNASRTLLFNIDEMTWDPELLQRFRVPAAVLPEVRDSVSDFGRTDGLPDVDLPILGVAGDQQAALLGQGCVRAGDLKSTYGTGCFALVNLGEHSMRSRHRLLTTVAWRVGGRRAYALEGSIFVAGAALQWLRDGLGLVADAAETEALAAAVPDTGGVVFVPAFTGLGAPHWMPEATGAVFGLRRDTGRAHVVRAALEAGSCQTVDLVAAMEGDGAAVGVMRVDGGMARNGWFCQNLADLLDRPVERPRDAEATARGAAFLAAWGLGWIDDWEAWREPLEGVVRFNPQMASEDRVRCLERWRRALSGVRAFARGDSAT